MMGRRTSLSCISPEDPGRHRRRYQKEGRRLFEVLDGHLAHHEYLADETASPHRDLALGAHPTTGSGISIEGLVHFAGLDGTTSQARLPVRASPITAQ